VLFCRGVFFISFSVPYSIQYCQAVFSQAVFSQADDYAVKQLFTTANYLH